MKTPAQSMGGAVAPELKPALLPIAQRVFWWGKPEEWLEDRLRFVAQVMTYGDWEEVCTTLKLLGEQAFLAVLNNPPPGVFDEKSWAFWHQYYHRPVPPLPTRQL